MQQPDEPGIRELKTMLESLRANLASLAGDSPFVKVGPTLHLFTSIHTLKANDQGNLDKINGAEYYDDAVSVQELERLISAHYRRAQEDQE